MIHSFYIHFLFQQISLKTFKRNTLNLKKKPYKSIVYADNFNNLIGFFLMNAAWLDMIFCSAVLCVNQIKRIFDRLPLNRDSVQTILDLD